MRSLLPVAVSVSFVLFSCRDAEPLADAGTDAGSTGCVIDAAAYEAGAVDPTNGCAWCDPARSTSEWTSRADGFACGAGRVCGGGACAARCFIDGTLHAAGVVNPDDGCAQCEPASSTTRWTSRADGTSCGGGEVCEAGTCRGKCLIGGVFVAASELNPANPCEQCTPATSTTAWSPRVNGASCAGGKVCEAGACTTRCFIGGAFYDAAAVNPANPCELCEPANGANAWSLRANGTSCGAGQVCETGACVGKCFIDGVVRGANELNPQNACERCEPASSTTGWTALANGAACASGRVCEAATCTAKCFIGGTLHADGAINPASECEQCVPMTATTAWTPRASVPLLVGGTNVGAQGWTVTQQANATISYGPDFTRLATTTATSASSGGQLLISRSIVDAGTPFTLRAEILVEQVNPHNTSDCGAAIMGAFTPAFGLPAQRAQMACLDAASVVWGDDSQSAQVAVTNGSYRTYVLSVDASNTARLSVDGTQVLTRANFVTNGTIAIGDQTNDPNVDGAMRIRSVSRVCP